VRRCAAQSIVRQPGIEADGNRLWFVVDDDEFGCPQILEIVPSRPGRIGAVRR
jgi:hypothetical protein